MSEERFSQKIALASAETSARLVAMVEGIKDEKIRAETVRAIIEKTVVNEIEHRTWRLALWLAWAATMFLTACITAHQVAAIVAGHR